MTSAFTEIKDVIQTVGIIVSLTLNFWQLRRNRDSIKIDNYSKIINALNKLRDVRIQNPDVERALFKTREQWKDAEIRKRVYIVELANIFEWAVLSFKSGLIGQKEWDDWSSMWKRVILADQSMREAMADQTIYTFSLEAHQLIEKWSTEIEAGKPRP